MYPICVHLGSSSRIVVILNCYNQTKIECNKTHLFVCYTYVQLQLRYVQLDLRYFHIILKSSTQFGGKCTFSPLHLLFNKMQVTHKKVFFFKIIIKATHVNVVLVFTICTFVNKNYF